MVAKEAASDQIEAPSSAENSGKKKKNKSPTVASETNVKAKEHTPQSALNLFPLPRTMTYFHLQPPL
jgi:hypothetical protein